ncbi:dihydropteroate synthase [Caldiplasma sukawensis]
MNGKPYKFFYFLKTDNFLKKSVIKLYEYHEDGNIIIDGKPYNKTEKILDHQSLSSLINEIFDDSYSKYMMDNIFVNKSSTAVPIVNATPDSFYDGSRYNISGLSNLLKEKPEIIDIGGESTRPGAKKIDSDEEIKRLHSFIEEIKKDGGIKISLDSYNYETCRYYINSIDWINDVSGMKDSRIPELCIKNGKSYILMHTRGTPETMNKLTDYNDLMGEISFFFFNKINVLSRMGLPPYRLILDPGLGFAKNSVHNFEICSFSRAFQYGFKRMYGHSRKRFLDLDGSGDPSRRLGQTISLTQWFVENNIEYIRVHDYLENENAIKMQRIIDSWRGMNDKFLLSQ